jgi:hypothetical protein
MHRLRPAPRLLEVEVRFAALLAMLSGCAMVPDKGAVAACHEVFEAWAGKTSSCALNASMPSADEVCAEAYSYSDAALGGCTSWIANAACDELHNEPFHAHCDGVIQLKTW